MIRYSGIFQSESEERPMPQRSARTTKLELRLTPEAKRTLQATAVASRRSVSEFVLESALRGCEEIDSG